MITCLLLPSTFFSQSDTNNWVRAFPITGYIVDLNDSVKLVQVHLYDGTSLKEKQTGLLRGIYRDKNSDTVTIGSGRCYLIKGGYYYFAVNYKKSGVLPREGDILYTIVEMPYVYKAQFVRLAMHFIGLRNAYEQRLYDRYAVFNEWTKQNEEAVIDSLVNDVHFTGKYFLENNPEMNVRISVGRYDGKMVLNTMITCTKNDIQDFLDYVIARPRLYAGREWKISEVFATWLTSGSPTVIKQ